MKDVKDLEPPASVTPQHREIEPSPTIQKVEEVIKIKEEQKVID